MKNPAIKIGTARYRAGKLKMGAYRQIMMLVDAIDGIAQDELEEEMLECVRLVFGLTKEQADQIAVADILPLFRTVTQWAQLEFTAGVDSIPNGEGPDATAGQN